MNPDDSHKPRLKNFRIRKLPIYMGSLLRFGRRLYYKYGPFALIQKVRIRMFNDHKGAWQHGRNHELSYWKKALNFNYDEWPEGLLQFRLDPHSELQTELASLIPSNTESIPRLLDVGSGPLTSLGKNINGNPIELICIDPLADDYLALTQGTDFEPIVRPRKIPGEEIGTHFKENSFDLAHARNSLDHAYDPAEIIRQMLWVVKPGGSVYLHHYVNEAERNEHKGFHQWNFCLENGSLMIGSVNNSENLNEKLGHSAEIECTQVEETGIDSLITVIKKKSSFDL